MDLMALVDYLIIYEGILDFAPAEDHRILEPSTIVYWQRFQKGHGDNYTKRCLVSANISQKKTWFSSMAVNLHSSIISLFNGWNLRFCFVLRCCLLAFVVWNSNWIPYIIYHQGFSWGKVQSTWAPPRKYHRSLLSLMWSELEALQKERNRSRCVSKSYTTSLGVCNPVTGHGTTPNHSPPTFGSKNR